MIEALRMVRRGEMSWGLFWRCFWYGFTHPGASDAQLAIAIEDLVERYGP